MSFILRLEHINYLQVYNSIFHLSPLIKGISFLRKIIADAMAVINGYEIYNVSGVG